MWHQDLCFYVLKKEMSILLTQLNWSVNILISIFICFIPLRNKQTCSRHRWLCVIYGDEIQNQDSFLTHSAWKRET